MDYLKLAEKGSSTFIVSVAGAYVAIWLRDTWRRFLRHRRMKREGVVPGQPITFLVMRKEDEQPKKEPGIKH